MILLQAEVLDLKADPKGTLEGTVVEAKLEKGEARSAPSSFRRHPQIGDALVVGQTFGRIKAMTDLHG